MDGRRRGPWSSHRPFDRDLGDHPEAALGERLGDEPAAERADPLAHPDDPVARAGLLPLAARRAPGPSPLIRAGAAALPGGGGPADPGPAPGPPLHARPQ